jgi:hypothetical protein
VRCDGGTNGFGTTSITRGSGEEGGNEDEGGDEGREDTDFDGENKFLAGDGVTAESRDLDEVECFCGVLLRLSKWRN